MVAISVSSRQVQSHSHIGEALTNGDRCLALDPKDGVEARSVCMRKLQRNFRLADPTAAIYGVGPERLVVFGHQVLLNFFQFDYSTIETRILPEGQNYIWEISWFLSLR